MSLEIERAREALKRGDAEKALTWLEEGVADAARAKDAAQLRHLGEEAVRIGKEVRGLRPRAQALQREAKKLAAQLPEKTTRRGWRRQSTETPRRKPVFEEQVAADPEAEAGSEGLVDFLKSFSARSEE